MTTDYMLRLEIWTEPSETGLLGLQLGAWSLEILEQSGCRDGQSEQKMLSTSWSSSTKKSKHRG